MIKLIPQPKKAEEYEGYLCVLPGYTCAYADFSDMIHSFSGTADRIWGLEITPLDAPPLDEKLMTPLTEAGASGRPEEEKTETVNLMALPGEERTDTGIYILCDGSFASGEYRIHADKTLSVTAGDREGVANAFATLCQICERTCDKYIKIPKCDIRDCPDNPFRGFLVDAARRWHPVDYLYRYADLCSFLKINRLIIHFTDDESYTLPSRAFPLLPTENRHYTENELRAFAEYAYSKGVTVIPEVDMPGHSAQFAVKYPDVFGTAGILDITDEVFSALEKIYDEVLDIFPYSKYMHIGGDEAILGRWNDSPRTLEYMKENGIDDIVLLYGHCVGRACDILLKKGITPIVWEGFHKESNHLVSKDVLVIAWENMYQQAPDLVDGGFTLLNASWRPLYVVSPWLKWSQDEILTFNKFAFDHWLDASPAFDHGISIPESSPMKGAILCAWGDYLKNYESSRLACQLEWASVRPRLAALSERAWNDELVISNRDFHSAYENFIKIFGTYSGENAYRGEL